MKRVLLTLALCSVVAIAGCGKKSTPDVPKSVSIYQQLQLTPEQNKKLADIRAAQRQKMESIRNEMDKERKNLLDATKTQNLSEEQKKANHEKYRAIANKMREQLAAERTAYDNALLGILDDNQKKTYNKYLEERENERIQREKDFLKKAKNK